MGVQIGLVGERADLAVEVAALAMRAGAEVVPVQWGGGPSVRGRSPADGEPPPGSDGPDSARAEGIDLLLVDVAALAGLDLGGPPPRDFPDARLSDVATAVICRSGEHERARAAAEVIGCRHVVELPLGAPWLLEALAPPPGSGLLAVVGAAGGVGTTTAAIACAVGAGRDCLLVDADPDSSGLDLPLGVAEGSGVRWGQIPDSSAPLDPGSLRASLPRAAGVTIVTGPDEASADLDAGLRTGRVAGVLGVGRAEFRRTVVDLGRGTNTAGLLGAGDAVGLVVPATVAGVVAGRRALEQLPGDRVLVLLRPSGWLPLAEVADRLDVESAVEIPQLRRAAELADCGDLLSGRTGRALRRFGERVWELVR